MQIYSDTLEFCSREPTAVTIGKFDGLHRGHQKLIRHILEEKKHGLESAVFLFSPSKVQRLLTVQEERDMLERMGVELLVECPFVPEILHMKPEDFIRDVLQKKLNMQMLTVGPDFRFGIDRSGDAAWLKDNQKKLGYRVDVLDKERYKDQEISSTLVREELSCGEMPLVHYLQGHLYSISGSVIHGRALGRTLGMPTVNLIPDPLKLLPPFGVYYSRVWIDSSMYAGITNVGRKPTVGGTQVLAETYLYDYSGDLYGKDLKVEFLAFRRPEKKFASVEELKECMRQDIQAGEAYRHEW